MYMRMPRISYGLLPVLVLVAGLLVSFSVLTQAQVPAGPTEEEIAESGITFPVAELGNCADKNECRNYCNEPGNMPACISFAKKHGLMNEAEAAQAKRFAETIRSGNSPGGCRGPLECEAYCSQLDHMDECLAFAESHGIRDPEIEEAKRIAKYIREGGQMPGGCNSRAECAAYCGDFRHAEECFEFAVNAGIAQEHKDFGGPEGFEGVPPSSEQFRKLMELARSGETPGGCSSKDQCERYCSIQTHFDECVDFGVKVGFMTAEEAERIRQTGGFGPGGCNSPKSCREYCNVPANQEACFSFASEHGFISDEEIRHAKEGFASLRAGLEQAPPEVAACLRSSLGPNIITDIQSGNLTPGPAIGERVRECFEKFGHRGGPQEIFRDAPPEVLACLEEKMGEDFQKLRSGEFIPTPEMADTFRVCFEKVRFDQFGGPGGEFGGPPPVEFLHNAPPGIAACLKAKLGDDFERIKSGDVPPPAAFEAEVRACFEEFMPSPEAHGGFGPPGGVDGKFDDFPPEVVRCIKNRVGKQFEQVQRGEVPAGSGFEAHVRACFEEFGRPSDAGPFIGPLPGQSFDLQNVPPDVLVCVKRAFGENAIERLRSGELAAPEFAAKVKTCFFEVESTAPRCEEFRFGNCPTGCTRVCVPSGVGEGFQTSDCGGPGSCMPPPTDGEPIYVFPPGSIIQPPPTTIFPPLTPEVLACVKRYLGDTAVRHLESGAELPRDVLATLKKCYVETQYVPPEPEPVPFPEPFPEPHICPALPTVDSCPEGQKKVVVFSSQECGTYYGCEDLREPTTTDFPIYQQTEDPAVKCAGKGGTWDAAANYCRFPEPTTTSEPQTFSY